MKLINIGKENATFQEIVALKENRTKRHSERKFFVEGVQNIKDALSNNWKIYAFIYSDFSALSNWARGVLKEAEFNYCLTQELMDKVSDKDETSELLAIVEMKECTDVQLSKCPLIVLLDRPSKKGNFGSIIRSCDALNVEQIFFTGHAVDIYDHNVITSTMGSFFKVPFRFLSSNEEYENEVRLLREKYKDFQVVGTSLQTDIRIEDCDFKRPTLLLVGNEVNGLSKFYNENADTLATIEMRDGIDSLNVACATTAVLFEISRQRKR